jgi:hypothetical protein
MIAMITQKMNSLILDDSDDMTSTPKKRKPQSPAHEKAFYEYMPLTRLSVD